MLHGTKAILFDLDETLLDDRAGQLEAARRVCGILAREAGTDALRSFGTYLEVSDAVWVSLGNVPHVEYKGLSGGQAIRLRVWEETLARLGAATGDLALEAVRLYTVERQNTYALFPDALAVLKHLRNRARIGIVTNGATGTQREKIRSTGLERYVDTIVVSGELGYGKPDPRIFHKALSSLGAGASEAVHVGDSLETDVAGAKAAGLGAIWLHRGGVRAPEVRADFPDAEIASLVELPALLSLHDPRSA